MLESADNRCDVRFCRSRRRSLQLHTDPRFKAFKICDEGLSLEFLHKKTTDMRRSFAVGWAILELSKYIMQKLYYESIQVAFGGNATICFSDTDSFAIAVAEESADKAMSLLSDVMDFSNLDPSHPLYDPSRKNKAGYLKNESPNDEIIKVVALKAKTYAFQTKNMVLSAKCKGVKKSARDKLKYDNYLKCVSTKHIQTITQHAINSKDHVNRLLSVTKTAFTSFDDKRYLLCSKHTCPYSSILIKYLEIYGKCFMCEHPQMLI